MKQNNTPLKRRKFLGLTALSGLIALLPGFKQAKFLKGENKHTNDKSTIVVSTHPLAIKRNKKD